MSTQEHVMTDAVAAPDCPLYVDMDGTLIATDSLWESILLLIKRRPFDALRLPFWLLRSRPYMKEQIALRVLPDPAHLPYRTKLLDFLREQRSQGRRLVLATASNQRVAHAVAAHLGIFDDVLATGTGANLAGQGKLQAIRQQVGTAGFDYMGNSTSDLPLWQHARHAYVVAADSRIVARARAICTPQQVFSEPKRPLAALRAMRPKQWIKNTLLIMPLFMAHQEKDLHKLLAVGLAFVAMCLCASSVYILNDLLDIEADRAHHRKRRRPLACGDLSIPAGIALFVVLLAGAFTVAAGVNHLFILMLAIYLVASTSYSFYFKQRLILDVILLSGLYTHRIIAGGVAANVHLSEWLLAFSMFMFNSLAFVKRYSELAIVKETTGINPRGRGYRIEDLELIASIGPANGYLAVLVFCQYINSDAVRKLYYWPQVLWAICPVLLYWITRIWFFARRRKLDDDPVIFAVRDRISWMAGILAAAIVLLARPR